MKRFYKLAHVEETNDGRYEVHLDSRPVKTTGKAVLSTSSKALAEAIMGEWARQGDAIYLEDMQLMHILATRIDYAQPGRVEITRKVLGYLDTDLLCYHAEKEGETEGIARLQQEVWGRWLAWFSQKFKTRLHVTSSLKALHQDEELRVRIRDYIDALDHDRFMILQMVTHGSGSIVLGLAFICGELTPEEVIHAVCLEEHYQARVYDPEGRYGPDPHLDKKEQTLCSELQVALRYLELTR